MRPTVYLLAFFVAMLGSGNPTFARGLFGDMFGGGVGGASKSSNGAPGDSLLERRLYSAADQTNQKLPTMVDSETRMDRVVPERGKLFTYEYTLVNLKRKDVDINKFNKEFASSIRERVCSNQRMYPLIKAGVTFTYAYEAKDGLAVGKIKIVPGDCAI